jgi:hypothetical protein
MGLLDQLSGILQQYGNSGGTLPGSVTTHFDQVAGTVPTNMLADGLAHAMRSNQTPDFAQLVGTLFSQGSVTQRQGMVNQLLAAVGQGAATPQQASSMPLEAVQQLASAAHGSNQNVVEMVSGFCAQHPDLLRNLGSPALGQILSHISQRAQP